MKTKRLVIGVCVLAAVTGSAHHVFGARFANKQAFEKRVFERRVNGVMSADSERQERYAALLNETKERLAKETELYKELWEKEVDCVGLAFSIERVAGAFKKTFGPVIESANSNVSRIQGEMRAAEEVVNQKGGGFFAFFAKRKAAAKIKKLSAELNEAKEHLSRLDYNKLVIADEFIENAQKIKRDAAALRADRLSLLTALYTEELSKRGEKGQENDLEKVRIAQSIEEVEGILLRGEQDSAIVCEVCKRKDMEVAFPEKIEHVGRDGLVYEYNLTEFERQSDRMCIYRKTTREAILTGPFGLTLRLQGSAWNTLMRLKKANA